MTRREYHVSVKAAIFNADDEVLMIRLDHCDEYGLPGGHIESNETPDQTMARELYEETGLQGVNLKHADFFMHDGEEKLVLAYTGTTEDSALKSAQNNLEGIGIPVWISKGAFNVIKTNQCYRDFVAKLWV